MRRRRRLNLAARPFVNERPIKRLALLLWVGAVVLTAVNGLLYARHFSGVRLTGEQQQEIRRRIAEEESRIAGLEQELSSIDLDWQNRQAAFINDRIGERTFSWSALFDHLSEVLPAEVRLATLAPKFLESRKRPDSEATRDEQVLLEIRGWAKSDQALLEFVDRFFEHELFRNPNLSVEAKRDGGLYEYSLSVGYLPQPIVAAEEEAETPAPEASDEGTGGDREIASDPPRQEVPAAAVEGTAAPPPASEEGGGRQ